MTKARSAQERWLSGLGVRFVGIFMVLADGKRVVENHVDDPQTLHQTVEMSSRPFRYAVVPYQGRWEVIERSGKHVKYFDNRDAAEMWAIHHV